MSAGRLEEARTPVAPLAVRSPSMSAFSFPLLEGLDPISSRALPPGSARFSGTDERSVSVDCAAGGENGGGGDEGVGGGCGGIGPEAG